VTVCDSTDYVTVLTVLIVLTVLKVLTVRHSTWQYVTVRDST